MFKEPKLPGWLAFILGLLILVPDIKHRIDFWWDAAQYLGGNVAMVGSVLTSPIFGAALMLAGIAYVVFVDESKKPILRHILWSILGWIVGIALFVSVFTISLVSFLTERLGPRHV